MKAFVTGVAGFIGSHVAEALLADGWKVEGCDTLETGRPDNVPDGVSWDERSVSRMVIPKCDLIVHCAAVYAETTWFHDVENNTVATANVADQARHRGTRVLYFQTSLPPVTSYAITKTTGLQYLKAWNVDFLAFRLANMYGPRNLSGPVPAFYKRLLAGEPCTIVRTRRDMVFVGDLVDGVMRAVKRTSVRGVIDVCSGTEVSIFELYEAVADCLDVTGSVDMRDPADDDVAKMELSPAQANRLLGWQATTGLRAGIAEAVAWYERFGVDRTFSHLRVA